MKQLLVKLGSDQLEKFSKATAIQALEEMVSNAYDADALKTTITVELDDIKLGVRGVSIVDDGVGIDYATLDPSFEMFGGSLKLRMPRTPRGRITRGRFGRGRFKAFALANRVRWVSRYRDGEVVREFTIVGDKTQAQPFQASDPVDCPPPERRPASRCTSARSTGRSAT